MQINFIALALAAAIAAPAAVHAATLVSLTSTYPGSPTVSDPTFASASQVFSFNPGPTRASGSANLITGVQKARAVHFGAGVTGARTQISTDFSIVPTSPGQTQRLQFAVNAFSDSFGSELPVGSAAPGGSLATSFVSTISLVANDTILGRPVGNFALNVVHVSNYQLQVDPVTGSVGIAGRSFAHTPTTIGVPNGYFGPFMTDFLRNPSDIGYSAIFEIDLLADANISYHLDTVLQAGANGAPAHGINADASRSAYLGFDLTDGATLVSPDPFLSGVTQLNLRNRLGGPTPVPLPATLPLLAVALGLVALWRGRMAS